MNIDLDKLEKTALAAKQGEWAWENESPDSWEKRGYIVKPFYMKPSEN